MCLLSKMFVIITLVNLLTLHGGISASKLPVNSEALICEPDPLIPEGIHYVPSKDGSGSLGLIGDVNDVLNGTVTPQTNFTLWTESTTGPFGFGAAAIGPLHGTGEALFVNGIALVRQTDNTTTNYFETVSGPVFRTPFSLFTLPGARPDGHFSLNFKNVAKNPSRNMSINELYENIYEKIGNQPFCYYGLTQYQQLDAIAISKAPIYNEPLFGDQSYYTQPNFQIPFQYGFTFGCAARFESIQDKTLLEKLSKLLYFNPMDEKARGQLVTHSHVVSLNKCLKDPKEIDGHSVQDVFHLLSNATISFIDASVFVLSSGDKLVELKGREIRGMTSTSPPDNNNQLKNGSSNATTQSLNFLALLCLVSGISLKFSF